MRLKQMELLDQYIRERNEVLFNFDEQKIKAFFKKNNILIPDREEVFWAAVCKAILGTVDAPASAITEAKARLDALGMSYKIW